MATVFLSFSACKNSKDGNCINAYKDMIEAIKVEIRDLFKSFPELLDSEWICEAYKEFFKVIHENKCPRIHAIMIARNKEIPYNEDIHPLREENHERV